MTGGADPDCGGCTTRGRGARVELSCAIKGKARKQETASSIAFIGKRVLLVDCCEFCGDFQAREPLHELARSLTTLVKPKRCPLVSCRTV
jgi:hypothetical protein